MAIICCPECGKEVSDKAPMCIHCGYPLQEQSMNVASLKVVIPSLKEPSPRKIPAIKVVREVNGMDLATAKALVEQVAPVVVKDGLTKNQADVIVQKFRAIGIGAKVSGSSTPVDIRTVAKEKNIVCCPQCGSTEYHAGARGFSIVTGFIGSGKTVLICLKCGHRWKPGK